MHSRPQAFTRIELLAVCAALAVLGALALPLLAATRADSDRAGCFNNLRLLGRAVTLWGESHDGLPPWITLVSRGGTKGNLRIKKLEIWNSGTQEKAGRITASFPGSWVPNSKSVPPPPADSWPGNPAAA